MIRTESHNGTQFVSVTSAMQLVKTLLGESPDYYGPLGNVHAMEGEGCHCICLDWVAAPHEPLRMPPCPENYPNRQRWEIVLQRSHDAFMQFVKQYEVDPIGVEQVDYSSTYSLMGHIDLPALFTVPRANGRRLKVRGPIDLKFTSSILESHRLQVRCYGRLDGMLGSNIGGIFWCDRGTGAWKFEEVSLVKNLDDVMAVSHAAKLYLWNERRKLK